MLSHGPIWSVCINSVPLTLERQLGNADIPIVKVNPLQAQRFAEAIGQRAKTDAVDAAMLARFGALDVLQTRRVISQTLSTMKKLLVARRGLVKDRGC